VNREEIEVSSPDSVLDAIRTAWRLPAVDLEITRYAGDALFAIAETSGRAAVSYWADQVEYVARAAQPLPADDSTHSFARSDNYDHEVPVEQVISRQEALLIIESFVLTGKPTGLSPSS
jgi:hypothetical protein